MVQINLLEDSRVLKTNNTRKLPLFGKSVDMPIYRVPLKLLHYNVKNDRIATSISKYNSEHDVKISDLDEKKRNKIIQDYLINSDLKSFTKTKTDIRKRGQQRAGVALSNGCIVDGNRRFSCLRSLYEEEPLQDYEYFETCIISVDTDPKQVKSLELELQYEDEKVKYDPIDKLVGVYNDVINGDFTPKEYATKSNHKETEIKKMVEKAELMAEFLESIHAPEAFYIAKELKLDGPLDEMQKKLNKLKADSDEEKFENAKVVLFDSMLLTSGGDRSRISRNFIDDFIIKNDRFNEFYEEYEPYSRELHQKLDNEEEVTTEFIRKNIRVKSGLNRDIDRLYEDYSHEVKIKNERNKPFEILKNTYNAISELDLDVVPRLAGSRRDTFIKEFKKIQDIVENINRLIKKDDD